MSSADSSSNSTTPSFSPVPSIELEEDLAVAVAAAKEKEGSAAMGREPLTPALDTARHTPAFNSTTQELRNTLHVFPQELQGHLAEGEQELEPNPMNWVKTQDDWNDLYQRRQQVVPKTTAKVIGWQGETIHDRPAGEYSEYNEFLLSLNRKSCGETLYAHGYALAHGGMNCFSSFNHPRGRSMHVNSNHILQHRQKTQLLNTQKTMALNRPQLNLSLPL
jgi:hypothetical protein